MTKRKKREIQVGDEVLHVTFLTKSVQTVDRLTPTQIILDNCSRFRKKDLTCIGSIGHIETLEDAQIRQYKDMHTHDILACKLTRIDFFKLTLDELERINEIISTANN